MLKSKVPRKNEKGMAVIEMIPIIIVVMLLINFSIGFFGVVHTGILNNIASRNYTFETFRNRTDLTYHIRAHALMFRNAKDRFSGIVSEHQTNDDDGFIATIRPLAFVSGFGGTDNDGNDLSKATASVGDELAAHRKIASASFPRGGRTDAGVHTIWIKTLYGICLDSTCGE